MIAFNPVPLPELHQYSSPPTLHRRLCRVEFSSTTNTPVKHVITYQNYNELKVLFIKIIFVTVWIIKTILSTD